MVLLSFLLFLPYLFESAHSFFKTAALLDKTRIFAFIFRILLYLSIYFLWPFFIEKTVSKNEVLIQKAKKAGLIFLSALLSIECLYWVGR